MHLPLSLPLTLLSASLALATPLSSLSKRFDYLTGHAKMYVGTPVMGGELYLRVPNDPGKSNGATSACVVDVTLEYEAQKCVCTVTTGVIQNNVACVATMVPSFDDEAEGHPAAGGKYPSSVDIKWVQYYFIGSGGAMDVVSQSPRCVDDNGSCKTLRITD
ncbi:MAG: hypothetical protein Q9220_005477 [cf. Caloplaca sp. 1 TL-2023]